MEQEGATMAQEGMEHWRRAVRWTLAGIFTASVMGGLLGGLTRGGNAALAVALTHPDRVAAPARPATVTPSVAATPPAAARAEHALIELSDLPSGWASGSAPAAPTHVSPWSPQLATCLGVSSRIVDVVPTKVDSPDFTSTNRLLAIEDSVSVYPSAALARAQYAAMASTRTADCMSRVAGSALQSSMQQQAGSGTTVGTVTFAGLPAGAPAPHVAGFTVTIPLARAGRELTVTSTQVDFVSGPFLHQLTFNGNGTAFPADLEQQVLTAAQTRS
jgi:hypothetical protein